MKSSQPYDAIVIGGGLVGLSTAYHLVDGGAKTLLIDRADRGRSTDAGAGILAPQAKTQEPETWLDFALQAVAYYPDLVARLEEEQAGDTGYSPCGKLLVAVADEDIPAFEEMASQILARQARRGVMGTRAASRLGPVEAKSMFPPLADIQRALYLPDAARVDGRFLSAALRRASEQRGLAVQPGSAESLEIEGGRVHGVRSSTGDRYGADIVVIAGGAWSQSFGEQLGIQIPVSPQRGQIVHVKMPNADTGAWPIVSVHTGHYILCFPDGRIVLGATRETGSGFDAHATVGGVHEVLTTGLRVAPDLALARILEIRVGLRPLSQDGMPVVGPATTVDGVFLATGHGPTGLQLGPFSGKVVAELALGRQISADIALFSIRRFLGHTS